MIKSVFHVFLVFSLLYDDDHLINKRELYKRSNWNFLDLKS